MHKNIPRRDASAAGDISSSQETNNALVVGVQTSSQHLFSKTAKALIRLVENYGVEGDAHAGSADQHAFHVKRYGQQPNLRQVHLIQAEFFDDLLQKGHTVNPGDLGENITTKNVDLLSLPEGTRLRLGEDALIELTGLRNPCHQIDTFQKGLLKHCVERKRAELIRKAGVMSIVVRGGLVQPGDSIEVDLPALPHKALMYRTPEVDGS